MQSKQLDLTVSIIIPVHNGGTKFERCLQSLTTLQPPPHEIIVVADGPSDGSWKQAEKYGLKIIPLSASGGPARARNIGAQHAVGDLLFFTDADVTIPSHIIGQIQEAFRNHPEPDALIGSYDDAPFESNFLSQYKNLLHHYVHQTSREQASTFWGACGVIRRDVFIRINGFNEKYRNPSIEDIELGYRLKKAGYTIQLAKHIQIKHLKHWGIYSLLKADIFYRALPWTDLILNEGKILNDLNLTFSSRICVVAAFMMILSLFGSFITPGFMIPALLMMLLLTALNRGVYHFFYYKRGGRFLLQAIPWHWLYFEYSGLSFAAGQMKFWLKSIKAKYQAPYER